MIEDQHEKEAKEQLLAEQNERDAAKKKSWFEKI
jgi:hypothetical protein